MLRGAISLSPEQMKVEMAKEQAVLREGRSFIPLMLINPNMNRVQGAIVLHATPYVDTITNMNKFHFEERGGQIIFSEGIDGGMHSSILDCEHNRKFLASMYYAKYWIIEDKVTDKEIKDLAEGIKNRAVTFDEAVQTPAEKCLTDDELEAQAAKLNAELANRKLAKSDAKMKTPVRKIIDATSDFVAKREEAIEPIAVNEQQQPEPTVEDTQRDPIPVAEPKPRSKRKSTLVNIE